MPAVPVHAYALLLAGFISALAVPAQAGSVRVDNAWVRATAPGQKVAGGFMDLTADADMTLVGGSSPVSRHFELHLMRMENGVMEMRALKQILLPKGKTIRLEPGGLHVMFIDLKQPIRAGQKVPVNLTFKDADGKERKVAVEARARLTSSD